MAFFLGEAFLGFLAIVVVALTLFPLLFDVQPSTEALIEICQWVIVMFFAVEYSLALRFAPSRKAFVLTIWHILDLLTIVLPVVSLLPSISDVFMSSPALRLLRLLRVISFGMRASGVMVRERARQAAEPALGPMEVLVLRNERAAAPAPTTWEEFMQWIKAPCPEWYNVANLSPAAADKIAATAGIVPAVIESHLFGTGFPHLDAAAHYTSLFVWFPEAATDPQIIRNGVLMIATEQAVFTLSRRPTSLMQAVAATLPQVGLETLPFPVRMMSVFFQAVLDRNEIFIGRFEGELRALEEVPVHESRPQFFEHTFRLKKELSAIQADLWRLKGILKELTEGRTKLPGSGGETEFFRRLADEADYLYETVVNTREGVLSLIDLHLNVVSFEMNRVMRVLAVVSVIGLIPAIVSGLLGMNVADNPWSFTLAQVAFGICFGMVICLYLFFVKGWLR
jgi:Mg2+ and Co2+ transporter CorA